MIILARSGSHGSNALRYAMDKEKARVIKLNYLPEHITPSAIWNRMKLHCMQHEDKHIRGRPIKDVMITLVVSPDPAEVEGWTDREWENLTTEVIHELDAADISDIPGCKDCKPTTFSNTMCVSAQHNDSKSGVIHLHLDFCRLDMDGNTNDLHQIHLRCMRAAENINRRHGWKPPAEIREERRQQMTDDGLNILRNMKHFDKELYFEELRKKGYKVEKRIDSKGKLCGYTLGLSATVIKASDLGNGHNLLASKLEDTWKKLHKDDIRLSRPAPVSVTSRTRPATVPAKVPTSDTTPSPAVSKPASEPTKPTYNINVNNKIWKCEIPEAVKDIFVKEAQLPEDVLWSTLEDITHTAMLLFCGYVDAAASISESRGGGGGGDSSKGWGRDKDEDDILYARRCLAQAAKMHTRSRGWHR